MRLGSLAARVGVAAVARLLLRHISGFCVGSRCIVAGDAQELQLHQAARVAAREETRGWSAARHRLGLPFKRWPRIGGATIRGLEAQASGGDERHRSSVNVARWLVVPSWAVVLNKGCGGWINGRRRQKRKIRI